MKPPAITNARDLKSLHCFPLSSSASASEQPEPSPATWEPTPSPSRLALGHSGGSLHSERLDNCGDSAATGAEEALEGSAGPARPATRAADEGESSEERWLGAGDGDGNMATVESSFCCEGSGSGRSEEVKCVWTESCAGKQVDAAEG